MTVRRVALDRPALPSIAERLAGPRAISVFGEDARAFGERLAARLRELGRAVRVVRVELRHAEGATREDDDQGAVLYAHPSALVGALAPFVASDAITIGIGSAFAAAVRAELAIWIRGQGRGLSLGPVERALAGEARLTLEDARLGVADAVAERLAAAGGPWNVGL